MNLVSNYTLAVFTQENLERLSKAPALSLSVREVVSDMEGWVKGRKEWVVPDVRVTMARYP